MNQDKGWYGDFCFAPPDLNFYAGVSGRGQESMFQRLNPPPPAVTVGVNRYSQYFFAAAAEARSVDGAARARLRG